MQWVTRSVVSKIGGRGAGGRAGRAVVVMNGLDA